MITHGWTPPIKRGAEISEFSQSKPISPEIRKPFQMIVYKKTGEWYIEWQRMTTSVTTNESKWE